MKEVMLWEMILKNLNLRNLKKAQKIKIKKKKKSKEKKDSSRITISSIKNSFLIGKIELVLKQTKTLLTMGLICINLSASLLKSRCLNNKSKKTFQLVSRLSVPRVMATENLLIAKV